MLKKIFTYIALTFTVLSYQNCKTISDSPFESKKGIKNYYLGSGGEAYDGKLRPGSYVHEVIRHGCSDVSKNQRSKTEIKNGSHQIDIVQSSALNCNTESHSANLGDLLTIPALPDYFIYKGRIFKHSDKVNPEWVTEILCFGNNSSKLHSYFEYNVQSGAVRGYNFSNLNTSESFQRTLSGAMLTYQQNKSTFDINLSSEVFKGEGRYLAKYFDKTTNAYTELSCFNGSGTLPRFKSIELDSVKANDYYGLNRPLQTSQQRVGFSKNSEIYYKASIKSEVLSINLVNSTTGKTSHLYYPANNYDKVSKVFWFQSESKQKIIATILDSKSVERDNPNIGHSLYPAKILEFTYDGDSIEITNELQTHIMERNSNIYIFAAKDSYFWFNFEDSKTIFIHQKNTATEKQLLQEVDLTDFEQDLDHKELNISFYIDDKISIRPNTDQFIFKVLTNSSRIFANRHRLFFTNFNNNNGPEPITPWAYIDWQKSIHWIHKNLFYFDLSVDERIEKSSLSYYDWTYKVQRVEVREDSIESRESIFSILNYERFHIEHSFDSLVLVVEPEYAYSSYDTIALKLDSKNYKPKKILNFNTSRTLTYSYSPYNDSLFLIWNELNGFNNYMAIGNFADEVVDSKIYSYGNVFSNTPKFFHIDDQQKTYLLANSTNSKSTIYSYTFDQNQHSLKTIKSGFDYMHRIEQTNRVILSQSIDSGFDFFLFDLNNQEQTSISDLLPCTSDEIVTNVKVLENKSKFIGEIFDKTLGRYRYIIFNLENM